MSFLTRYGSYWGDVPETSGRILWVAPSAAYTIEGQACIASDFNKGMAPDQAFLTLAYAMTQVTANVGDVIILLPGTHTMATAVAVNIAGITITGLPGGLGTYTTRMPAVGPQARTVLTAAAATNTLTVTATDVEIAFVHFRAISAAVSIAASNAADRLYVHDCTFDMYTAADSLSTVGIGLGFSGSGTNTRLDNAHIRNCYFLADGAQGGAVEASNTCVGTIIENSTFQLGNDSSTAWANAIFMAVSVHLGTVVRDCDLLVTATGTTVTDFIDAVACTVDGSTMVYRCYVPVGGGAFNTAATADGVVVDSYTAGTTGTNTVLATT